MRVFGFDQLIELIADESQDLAQPRRQAELMRVRWDDLPLEASRPGHKYFPRMLEELVNKPQQLEPFGDYSSVEDEIFAMGETSARLITTAAPALQPVIPTGMNYNLTDIFDAFQYLDGFTSGVARFVKLDGDTWLPYIGETDTSIPETPSFDRDT